MRQMLLATGLGILGVAMTACSQGRSDRFSYGGKCGTRCETVAFRGCDRCTPVTRVADRHCPKCRKVSIRPCGTCNAKRVAHRDCDRCPRMAVRDCDRCERVAYPGYTDPVTIYSRTSLPENSQIYPYQYDTDVRPLEDARTIPLPARGPGLDPRT